MLGGLIYPWIPPVSAKQTHGLLITCFGNYTNMCLLEHLWLICMQELVSLDYH
ncbi:hypothetical protein Gohar_026396 [Gossypium harknessii]|uniref:Uncharacterized protein n=1 Tax=Gossypium harknessii TaxID=34285 RepID=A0A7J9HRG2_9ROSI|nr:hypothetical protein [Gossypium harknessii]